MNTYLKSNVGARNICVRIWRQFIILMCNISPMLIYPVIVGLVSLSYYGPPPKDPTSLREIKAKYPSQNDFFWRTFESGVDDVLELNRPSNIMVMYQPQSEKLLDSILQDLSGYMVRKLESRDARPIIVEAHELNEPPFSEDYGEVVSRFGEELRTRHVMIVKNIDQVVGKVAQAFHSLCDEYTPYVERAVIIFTLKLDEYPDKDHFFVESLLQKLWTDIEEDTFSPLVTRMLGMILRVNDATQTYIPNKLVNIRLAPIFIGFVVCLFVFFIRRYYTDIALLCQKYPDLRESAWENLSKVYLYDHFFLFSHHVSFLEALIKYLKKQLNLSNVITLNEEDMKNIKQYCKKNKKYLTNSIVLIHNIEKVQGKLCELFCTSRDVKSVLKANKFPVIYIVTDENTKDAESVLNETFIKLLPSMKVFS